MPLASDSPLTPSLQECGFPLKQVGIQIPKLKENYIFYKLTILTLSSYHLSKIKYKTNHQYLIDLNVVRLFYYGLSSFKIIVKN